MVFQIVMGIIFSLIFCWIGKRLLVLPTALIGSIIWVDAGGMLIGVLDNIISILDQIRAGVELPRSYYIALIVVATSAIMGVFVQGTLLSKQNAGSSNVGDSLINIA